MANIMHLRVLVMRMVMCTFVRSCGPEN